jgi:hypothetical protein
MRNAEKKRRQSFEFGIGTRRRPIGRDYAAAKDAEFGKKKGGPKTEAFDLGLRILIRKMSYFRP